MNHRIKTWSFSCMHIIFLMIDFTCNFEAEKNPKRALKLAQPKKKTKYNIALGNIVKNIPDYKNSENHRTRRNHNKG